MLCQSLSDCKALNRLHDIRGQVWNALRADLRSIKSKDTFKRHLKT